MPYNTFRWYVRNYVRIVFQGRDNSKKVIVLKSILPVVPHKAVAEVSKIGSLWERLIVVNQGWQSESTDGPKGA